MHLTDQLIISSNRSPNRSASQSINQVGNHLGMAIVLFRCVILLVKQCEADLIGYLLINWSIDQSINQSIRHRINKSIKQTISIYELTCQSIDQPNNRWKDQGRSSDWLRERSSITKSISQSIICCSISQRTISQSLINRSINHPII